MAEYVNVAVDAMGGDNAPPFYSKAFLFLTLSLITSST